MKTVLVAQWLANQGRTDASNNFLSTLGHMENVDYEGIEGFLYLYYNESTDETFRSMQCYITTTLTFI
jgi:hypothetical protein